MKSPAFAEHDLVASITKESFFEFVKEFWPVIVTEPLKINWHIEYLCYELQLVAERVFKMEPREYDLIINISPGSSKSTLCSQLFPAWCWARAAWIRTISASFEHRLSLNFSRKSRDCITSEKYQLCFPHVKLKDDQNNKGFYETTEKGDRLAISSGGTVIGAHAHFIIIDDPINPKAAVSEAERLEINRWMKEDLPSRKVDKAVTPMILIMQRLHQDDPTQQLLDRADGDNPVKHICIPADDSFDIKPAKLRRRYVNGLMDPVRLGKKVLLEQKKQLGEYGFAGQYGQSPVPKEGGMFKVERIHIDVPPTYWVSKVRYWDKAGSEGHGAFTVGLLMARDKRERFWVLDVIREQVDTFRREEIIKQTAKLDGLSVVIGIEQEPGSGGKESAQRTIQGLSGFRIRVDRPVGDKILRADPYSTAVNAENVYVPPDKPWVQAYLEELRFFPFGKFKDQVDASSGAFSLISNAKRMLGGF
jgi:predicted phage terminase large subunit-like protein